MEQILLCQIREEDARQIRRLAAAKKIRVRELESGRTGGRLADLFRGEAKPSAETLPEESLLLFCEVTDKHFDKLLFELRSKKIQVDYKAVVTPVNQQWTLSRLYTELKNERLQMERMNNR